MSTPYSDIFSSCPKSWEVAPLQEHIFFQEGPGILAKDFRNSGIPLLRLAGVGEKFATLNGCNFLDPEMVEKKWAHFRLDVGDIVTSTSASFGRTSLVNKATEGAIPYTGIIRFRPKTNRVLPGFIELFLRSSFFEDQARSFAAGSVIQHFGPTHLKQMAIALPPVDEQAAIAEVIGALDDKIDLNRRMNAKLESTVQALFRDWFVNFGPVRAKMEGGQSSGLLPEMASLFSDALDGEGIPTGWRKSRIGDEVKVVGGATPSTKEDAFWSGGTNFWATPKDLSNLDSPVLLGTERQITKEGLARISSGLLPVGTVLLSSRAPIGYLAIAEVPTAINQGFIAMTCNQSLSNLFVLFWCRERMDLIVGNANGSTFQEISKTNFKPIPVVVPPKPILDAFDSAASPFYNRIVANLQENKTLIKLRDSLLPLLMSGQIRLSGVHSVPGGNSEATA